MTRAELIARMRHIDLIDFRDEDEDEHVAQLVDAIQSIGHAPMVKKAIVPHALAAW